jgi:hypothetical protein
VFEVFDAILILNQRIFMGFYEPRLLHFEVLGGSLPLLPQQLLDFIGLVGLQESDLVLQLHFLALNLF